MRLGISLPTRQPDGRAPTISSLMQRAQLIERLGFDGIWHPGMMSFVRNFPARVSSVPALATLASPASPVSAISPN